MTDESKKLPRKPLPHDMFTDRHPVAEMSRGEYRDDVFRRDPKTGLEVKVEETDWKSNRIVGTISLLIAGLMRNEPAFTGGILQHAQGRGEVAFDTVLPTPGFGETALRDEYFRKPPDSITFVDLSGNPVPPNTLTKSILIKTTLGFAEANGVSGEFIREQGLFGGNATSTPDSGMMVNLIFHKARFKDANTKIVRFIRLIF